MPIQCDIWWDLSPRKIAELSEEYRAQAISIDKFLNSIRNSDNLIVCRKQLFCMFIAMETVNPI